MATVRARGWRLFDEIVATADLRDVNPWVDGREGQRFEPDYDTLELLLGVPVHLGATSQSGVPALALDVWVAHEFRRAGFDPDAVWPRASEPRVLPGEITEFLGGLPAAVRQDLHQRLDSGKAKGTAKSANLLGKNYVKQVDVVMSSWATGPELMISTKRMDSSFGKNAANRVEESYGDAKNLRLRHPAAALGFVYALNAVALESERTKALWLIDLLQKLGREDDAYDSVALILPDLTGDNEAAGAEEPDEAGPLPAGAVDEGSDEASEGSDPGDQSDDLSLVARVGLYRDEVPNALAPGRFLATMCTKVLERSPINFHERARELHAAPLTD